MRRRRGGGESAVNKHSRKDNTHNPKGSHTLESHFGHLTRCNAPRIELILLSAPQFYWGFGGIMTSEFGDS